jgi:periplasmic protein TonB
MKFSRNLMSINRRPLAVATGALLLASLPAAAQDAGVVSPAPLAPAAAKPSPKALSAWRGKVLAHLASHKKDVRAGKSGTSMVTFQINRAGRVLSAQVVKSSGNQALDNAAVALTKRASPLPAPPGEIAGETLYLKVPVQFTR